MNILLTNDDGIHADGLKALIHAFRGSHQLVVAAPNSERSASGHSISLKQKLEVEEWDEGGVFYYSVNGTPADCVKFALSEIRRFTPALIISGINQGANTGVSVYYSGTISAAREGFINGVPSMAVSLCSKVSKDFDAGVEMTKRLVCGYAAKAFPLDVMLNVNIPAISEDRILGVRMTKQAASRFIEEFVPEAEKGGKKIYTLAGEIEIHDPDGTSDEEAVAEGHISITPLKLDLTEYRAMPIFEKWLGEEGGRITP